MRCVEPTFINCPILIQGDRIDTVHHDLLQMFINRGVSQGSSLRITNVIYTVNQSNVINKKYFNRYLKCTGDSYFNRANLLFNSDKSLKWKANYKSRLETDNQYENMIKLLSIFPGTKSACATFLLPKDMLRARVIQASVPCPLCLNISINSDKLGLNVFFRAQDILNLAYWDMYFLAKLQKRITKDVIKCRSEKSRKSTIVEGTMTFFICNGFIRKRDKHLVRELLSCV